MTYGKIYSLDTLYSDPPMLYKKDEYGYMFNINNEHIKQLFDIYCSKNGIDRYTVSDHAVRLEFERSLRVFFAKEYYMIHYEDFDFSRLGKSAEQRRMNNLITIIVSESELIRDLEKAENNDGKTFDELLISSVSAFNAELKKAAHLD